MEIATFAAGCFWSVEDKFKNTNGVLATQSGYMGGEKENPTYEEVCAGNTGHAEVVQVSFDPNLIPYEKLLFVFWQLHDPTTLNQQGPDVGTQYRSSIFYHSAEQAQLAEKSKQLFQEQLTNPIVTEIVEASVFYKAEEYHQCYLEKNGLGSCH